MKKRMGGKEERNKLAACSTVGFYSIFAKCEEFTIKNSYIMQNTVALKAGIGYNAQ